jgi:hypothetical protein
MGTVLNTYVSILYFKGLNMIIYLIGFFFTLGYLIAGENIERSEWFYTLVSCIIWPFSLGILIRKGLES